MSEAGQRSTPWCDTIHTLALAVWLSALVLGGGSAAVVFPTVRAVNPVLTDFPGFEAEHWRIAAGIVQQKIFAVSDRIQWVAASIAVLTLGARLLGVGTVRAPRRKGALLHAFAIVCAAALLLYHATVLSPRMTANLARYHRQARAGDVAGAHEARVHFDADHPTAGRVLGANAALVVLGLWASVWVLARPFDRALCKATMAAKDAA